MEMDLAVMREILQFDEEDMAMGIHMVLTCFVKDTAAKYELDESTYGKALTDAEYAAQLDMQYRGQQPKRSIPILTMPPPNMSSILRSVIRSFS
jgi:hypothetical protein